MDSICSDTSPPRRCAATLPLQGRVKGKSLRRLNPLLLPTNPAPRQHRLQERPGITALLPHDLLRRSRGDDLAAAVAAFGAEVDDPVGGFDDFEVVLDDHDRVAGVDQLVQHFQELCHVVEVQAGGGFI